MKSAGYLIETLSGLRGRTRHSDHLVNGKIIVYLEDLTGRPILDKTGGLP